MKPKTSKLLGVALSLVVFAAGGGQHDGLNLLVQQIRTVGPRQWLGLMAGALVPGALGIAPVAERLARLLPGRAVALAASGTRPVDPA